MLVCVRDVCWCVVVMYGGVMGVAVREGLCGRLVAWERVNKTGGWFSASITRVE